MSGIGAAGLPAAGVAAPHVRSRLYCVADSRRGGAQHQRRDMAGASGQVAPEIQQRQRVRDDFGDGRPNRRLDYPASNGTERSSTTVAGRNGQADGIPGTASPWGNCEWVWCRDGYYRRVNPSIFLLADGIPARMGELRGLGNAVVPQAAAVFIQAFMESDC